MLSIDSTFIKFSFTCQPAQGQPCKSQSRTWCRTNDSRRKPSEGQFCCRSHRGSCPSLEIRSWIGYCYTPRFLYLKGKLSPTPPCLLSLQQIEAAPTWDCFLHNFAPEDLSSDVLRRQLCRMCGSCKASLALQQTWRRAQSCRCCLVEETTLQIRQH